jgi:hypothetical protein
MFNWVWIPETSHKILLRQKAKKQDSGPFDDTTKLSVVAFKAAIFRPVQMLFLDPIVLLSSLYISFIFGIL